MIHFGGLHFTNITTLEIWKTSDKQLSKKFWQGGSIMGWLNADRHTQHVNQWIRSIIAPVERSLKSASDFGGWGGYSWVVLLLGGFGCISEEYALNSNVCFLSYVYYRQKLIVRIYLCEWIAVFLLIWSRTQHLRMQKMTYFRSHL